MLLRAATETALELKPCMNINLSCDMKIEGFIMQGFLLISTWETVEIIIWVLSLLHFVTWVAGSGQTAPVNVGCHKTWSDLCLSLCYWIQPWHDQNIITVTLHSHVGGKGLSCQVERGDWQMLHYMWHVWEGQRWKGFGVPRSWGRAIGKPDIR